MGKLFRIIVKVLCTSSAHYMTPIVNVRLDKRRMTTTGPNAGKYHIKIMVTFITFKGTVKDWDEQPYKTGLFATPEEYAVLMENDPKKKTRIERLKEIRKSIDAKKALAESIIDKYKITDQKKFDLYFLSNHQPESLAGQFDLKINELNEAKPEPKISSAEKYETALHSIQEFFGLNVSFHMCTAERLQQYEDWYTSQNRFKDNPKRKRKPHELEVQRKKSLTSVGINMRCLRHIFKRAIKAGIIPQTLYPFGEGEDYYTIPEGGDDTKQFLEHSEKDEFLSWKNESDELMELYDYAVFSYLGFGINFSDIARLRKSEIKGDYISKVRQKKKGRKKKSKQLLIPIHQRMREIMWRRGNKTIGKPDDYVFPILNDSMTAQDKFNRIRKLVKDTNEVLALIAKEKNLSIRPTTYTLRHTFSKQFMDMGASTEELQDALAHGTAKTTENYKHGFSMEKKKKFSQGL